MGTVEKIFGVLAGVAIVNIVFFAPQSPNVMKAVFGGTAQLFGALTRSGTGAIQGY